MPPPTSGLGKIKPGGIVMTALPSALPVPWDGRDWIRKLKAPIMEPQVLAGNAVLVG